MIAINRHLWILRFRNMLDEIGWVWPTFQNVAVALIPMNYPLIGEKRTISDSEGMCLCMFGCLGCLTIPLHLSLSLSCVWLCVCERIMPTHAVLHHHHEKVSGFCPAAPLSPSLHSRSLKARRWRSDPSHSRRFPVSVTLRSASFSVFY